MPDPIRVGNCSGFYGDRFAAMREMLDGGPLDVLTGDYLAELTMLILFRSRAKDPSAGYAASFLRQLEQVLGTALDRGVRIVANAGGLNPAGCAAAVRTLAERLGLTATVAHVAGDDLLPRWDQLAGGLDLRHLDTGAALTERPVTANAYLGGWGITRALAAGADVVITGRVTDAALVTGPAAWWHGWAVDDWDRLAGAVVAGHILECGAQATGGNYSFFQEVPRLEHVGFPLAEIAADGSSVITKHAGTGGQVSVGTVTAQLLYEIGAPAYLGPDVTTRFDTIRLTQQGPDRVQVSGVRGAPPPPTCKVALTFVGGLRNTVTFVLTGLDIPAKAELATTQLLAAIGGPDAVRELDVRLARTDQEDPPTNEASTAQLRITVKDNRPDVVGRRFSAAAVELALASYPGATLTAPPGDATPYGVYWPVLVPAEAVTHQVVLADGSTLEVDRPPAQAVDTDGPTGPAAAAPVDGPVRRAPLGAAFGARSGDKGGTANVGVWARGDAGYRWLVGELTVARFQQLLPETAGLPVERFALPNLLALNFVVPGLLGEGVASSTRPDPQAKGLGEWLRARVVELPEAVLAEAR